MTKRIWFLLATLGIVFAGSRVYMAHAERTVRAVMIADATHAMTAATIDCSRDARLDAAMLHYKVGCILATLRICSAEREPGKFSCYSIGQAECDKYSIAYRAWLGQGK